ncbi:hypothetical protein CAPTEDRAFT_202306 [Capitella teleta]|uniref:Phosphatidylethanolamine-binding protein 4 n=1 Tax=Capitella teleta TaxID=283909 RepID=R7V5Z3_CAPTE|nr:hypothetical protein CAPTEDRAFT_202306 [Capitella teleta]|eukprot:ELU11165.1 hypothetical protein CAPTEDRAFT_202306 [Capitella teleta]
MLLLKPYQVLWFVALVHQGVMDCPSTIDMDRMCESKTIQMLTFNQPDVSCGESVPPTAFEAMPRIKYPSANPDKLYFLLMVDPDAPNPVDPTLRYWRHWAVGDIKTKKDAFIPEYAPPSPPPGTGEHRYQFLLVEQSSKGAYQPITGDRGHFNLCNYLDRSGLSHSAVAVFQFQTENK